MPLNKRRLAQTALAEEKTRQAPLRILTIFFHPAAKVTAMGGAEKRFVETLKIFCKQPDLKIKVLESAPSLLAGSDITCKKYSLASSFRGSGWLGSYLEWALWNVKAFFMAIWIASRQKPHIILVPNNTLPNLASGYVLGLVLHLPICAVVHHLDVPSTGVRDSLYDNYRRIGYQKSVSFVKTIVFYVTLPLLRKTHTIIAVSNFTAKTLRTNGVTRPTMSVNGNAVDLDFIRSVKPQAERRTFDGIFVGRISKEKGVLDLLKVWKRVVETRKDAGLMIVGSGLELSSVKRCIRDLDLEKRVLVRGLVSDRELFGLLKSSRVFVFPSVFEGWGIAVAEALACGTSVVAYDIPALREVFGPSRSVFLVPVGRVDKMAQAVLNVLEFENRERLSKASVDYAERFDWNKVAAADLQAIRGTILQSNR